MTTQQPAGIQITPPLDVSIKTINLTLGDQTLELKLQPPIEHYAGQKLFINSTTIVGGTITIDISNQQMASTVLPAAQPITAVALNVDYIGPHAIPTVVYNTKYNGAPLGLTMKLSAKFESGHLFVSDKPPTVTPSDDFLMFVLVQENWGSKNPTFYQVNWIEPIGIGPVPHPTTARVLPKKNGGITGPMGIATP
jgi:hypothetical protein